MNWVKKGLIYNSSVTVGSALTHAALPTPFLISDDLLRIYYAFRAEKNVSRIGFVDVNPNDPKKILDVNLKPVMDIGLSGAFDDNGVVPISIVDYENKIYLYYGGFKLGEQVPYYLFSGLAISHDRGDTFTRCLDNPILTSSEQELFFRTAPYVIKDGLIWKMWYVAGSSWVEHKGKKLPEYTIKYLTSNDGVSWGAQGHTCFDTQKDEHGFGRPYVVRDATQYKMYYSIRTLSNGYRLGYAESHDGTLWVRKDAEMGLDVSIDGWDSQSVCYSSIIECSGKTYLFYNGNNYGETGFGYAELAPS